MYFMLIQLTTITDSTPYLRQVNLGGWEVSPHEHHHLSPEVVLASLVECSQTRHVCKVLRPCSTEVTLVPGHMNNS